MRSSLVTHVLWMLSVMGLYASTYTGVQCSEQNKVPHHKECKNIHLQVTTLPYTYYSTVAFNGTTNITEYSGLTFDIFNAFADRNNITYTITPPPDLSWGVQRSDGSWSGAIGMLVHSNVDVGVLPFAMSVERVNAVAFSDMFTEGHYVMILKIPEQGYGRFLCLKPLTLTVWIVYLVALICFVGASYFVIYCSGHKKNVSVCEWTLDIVGTLFVQSVSSFIHFYPNRIIKIMIVSWWILMFVVTSYYCSNLKAMFSITTGMNYIASMICKIQSCILFVAVHM